MNEGGETPLAKIYKFLVQHESWMDVGKCYVEHADPRLFVLDQGYTAQEARQRYCGRCSVRQECLDYGKRTGSVGVWGGEVLAWGGREAVQITPIYVYDRLAAAEELVHPKPLARHQIPFVIFKPSENQSARDTA